MSSRTEPPAGFLAASLAWLGCRSSFILPELRKLAWGSRFHGALTSGIKIMPLVSVSPISSLGRSLVFLPRCPVGWRGSGWCYRKLMTVHTQLAGWYLKSHPAPWNLTTFLYVGLQSLFTTTPPGSWLCLLFTSTQAFLLTSLPWICFVACQASRYSQVFQGFTWKTIYSKWERNTVEMSPGEKGGWVSETSAGTVFRVHWLPVQVQEVLA